MNDREMFIRTVEWYSEDNKYTRSILGEHHILDEILLHIAEQEENK